MRLRVETRHDPPPGHEACRRGFLAGGGLVAIAAALFLVSGCATGSSRTPATHRVAIRAMRYEPAVIQVAPGDTVRWTNLDLVPHTITARADGFDSGNLPPDSSWALVLGQDGVLDYSCLYHPGMKGSIVAAR